jgi:hypothetical protein
MCPPMHGPYPPFTDESIHRMLAFLPRFESGEFRDVHSHYLQAGKDSRLVDELISEVYQSGFVLPFNWTDWDWRQALASLDHSDLNVVRKLLTSFVRGDRFSGGALAGLCANGTVAAVLRRLKALVQGGGGGPLGGVGDGA